MGMTRLSRGSIDFSSISFGNAESLCDDCEYVIIVNNIWDQRICCLSSRQRYDAKALPFFVLSRSIGTFFIGMRVTNLLCKQLPSLVSLLLRKYPACYPIRQSPQH